MPHPIEKLINHIDQIVFWLKENPDAKIPLHEKSRINTILNKVLKKEEISDENWDKIKPKPTKPIVHNEIKKTITSKWSQIKPSKNFRTNVIPTLPIELVQAKRLIGKRDNELIKCPNCACPLSPKNLNKHLKRCPSFVRKKVKGANKESCSNSYTKNSNAESKYINDSYLDGSKGYHIFRENGKFGSHSSFDGMGDESHP